MELTVFTHELLDRHGIRHWLDFGALLGAVRDGSLIPWDTDVDFGCVRADRPRIVALAQEVGLAGHVLDASDPVIIRINFSRTNLQHADIFLWELQDGRLSLPDEFPSHGFWPGMHEKAAFPLSLLEPLGAVRLEGHTFPAPAPPARYLAEHLYGPDYLTPTRPPPSWDLRPVIEAEELTPLVSSLLGVAAELERRLFFLKAHPRLSHLAAWQRWIDSGLPTSPDPSLVERLRASLAAGERGPTVDALIRSIAVLTQSVDELDHHSPTAYLRRASRRFGRLVSKGRRSLLER